MDVHLRNVTSSEKKQFWKIINHPYRIWQPCPSCSECKVFQPVSIRLSLSPSPVPVQKNIPPSFFCLTKRALDATERGLLPQILKSVLYNRAIWDKDKLPDYTHDRWGSRYTNLYVVHVCWDKTFMGKAEERTHKKQDHRLRPHTMPL